MARYTDSVCRQCRRENLKLFLKGDRCYSDKCAFDRRGYPPGQHGERRGRKMSDYGIQLREKQKVKRMYGLSEKQFHLFFLRADGQKGITGTSLLVLLERRLDNVIYQLGFATSRSQARQMVSHGYVCVNDRRVNIPSFLVKENDEISLKFVKKGQDTVKANIEVAQGRTVPAWLAVDAEHFKAKVIRFPEREDIGFPVNEQLIVELYSR